MAVLSSSVMKMNGTSSVPNIIPQLGHLKNYLSPYVKKSSTTSTPVSTQPKDIIRAKDLPPEKLVRQIREKPLWKKMEEMKLEIDVSKTIKSTSTWALDAIVDSMFVFVDQPILPSQQNFLPIDENSEAIEVDCAEGIIPTDFPEGVYIRNGPNPLFGGLKITESVFGRSSNVWVEGEGMLHAFYFNKNVNGNWVLHYKNRFVESETFKLEKERGRPSFIPALEGDAPAILAAYLMNGLRFGFVNKYMSNTNVFEHSGKLYSIAENYIPQEIDMFTLETYGSWDINGAWTTPFTSHPKKAPGTGELVTMGVDAIKPYFVVGVISADGEKLLHKVDLNLDESRLTHDIGVTQQYNVIIHHCVSLDISRVFKGGALMKYDKEATARIGVMPRYGDADSVKWFNVNTNCTYHIINTFEDGDEVVVRGCKALHGIFPGPELGKNKFEWFSKGFKKIKQNDDGSIEEGYLFHRVHEWRLDMITGKVRERYLTGTEFSMDFPMVNGEFVGIKHKYGYTQVVDSVASSISGQCKYGGLAKLYFDEPGSDKDVDDHERFLKVEYHSFPENTFCTGTAFVPKIGALEEDDGWLITYIHDESANESWVYIIDARNFGSKPMAKIKLPQRVPYGFHGTFVPMSTHP